MKKRPLIPPYRLNVRETFSRVRKESNFLNMSKNHEFSSHEKNKLGKLDINLMQETVSSEIHRNLKYYFPFNSICKFPIYCQNFPIFRICTTTSHIYSINNYS